MNLSPIPLLRSRLDRLLPIAILFAWTCARAWCAEIVHVSPTGSDATGSGSREAPFGTIQHAMDAAPEGGEVILLPGTYHGAGNRDLTFRGKAMTVRSEAGRDATIIDGGGPAAGDHRGFLFDSGETPASVLEGVTIRRFRVQNPYGDRSRLYGGGILIRNSSPIIRDCVISENRTYPLVIFLIIQSRGAGVYVDGGSPSFIRCSIVDNVAEGGTGGTIYTSGKAGGVWAEDATIIFQDCDISRNVAEAVWGAGSTGSTYGGLGLYNCDATLDRCTVSENEASLYGGISVGNGTTCMTNCTVNGNGRIGVSFASNETSRLHIEHCTIVNNVGETTSFAAGVDCHSDGFAFFRNTIIAFNGGSSHAQVAGNVISRGGNILSNNIVNMPLLGTDMVSTDFTLSASTPLSNGHYFEPLPGTLPVDAGVPVPGISVDQTGRFRDCDGDGDGIPRPDSGASELPGEACVDVRLAILGMILGVDPPYPSNDHLDSNLDGAIDAGDLIPFDGCLP